MNKWKFAWSVIEGAFGFLFLMVIVFAMLGILDWVLQGVRGWL
jgi:hypothetical protein